MGRRAAKSRWGLVGGGVLAAALATGGPVGEARAQVTTSTAFDQGRVRLSLGAGSGGSFGNRYILIGAGLGYYVLKGFEVALDGQVWLAGDPFVANLSPSLRYVFWQTGGPVMPYVGAFYRRLFIDSDIIDDIDSVGGRGGIFYAIGRGGFLGLGVAYEQILDCDEDLYETCTDIYPELAFSLSF